MHIAIELSERVALTYNVTEVHEYISFTSYISADSAEVI